MSGERKEYIEVSLEVAAELQESLSSFLIEAGAGGAWIDGAKVIAFFNPDDASRGEIEERVAPFLERFREEGVDIPSGSFHILRKAGEDWNGKWKAFYRPVRISDRLTVSPPWENPPPESQEGKILWIDPGMGFGTGTHPTTRNCLVFLDRFFRNAAEPRGLRALDLGSGSGILAIAMALSGAGDVVAADIDGEAIESMRHNFLLNQVGKKIRLRLGSILPADRGGYDLVAANLTAGDLVRMGSEIAGSLAEKGSLIVSGILSERRADVEACFKFHALAKTGESEEENWLTQIWRKR